MIGPTFSPVLTAFPYKRLTPTICRSLSNALSNTSSPPHVRQNASLETISPHKLPPRSVYIHLPFCRKRCHYCDFPIVALGSTAQPDIDPRVSNYIQLLCREIDATNAEFETNPPLETVYFGGGTPSLVPAKLVSLVLDKMRRKFGVCSDAEISMEMDPGTFDAMKMKELMGLGVNRVSLGVQAFQEELLRTCGRAHGVEEVYEAIEVVKGCGVENWSMDLISSLPHQTPEMWEESLRLTVEAQPPHISVYDLQIEQDTKFGKLYSPGEFPLPSETWSADFYRMASSMLSNAGYDHYEISSYCKSGSESKHNFTYWKNQPFYAFGLGSASYIDGIRFSRPRKMKEYEGYVRNLENGEVDCRGSRQTDWKDFAMDVVMLSLRTSKGLDLEYVRKTFDSTLVYSLCQAYKPYVESGHVLCLDEHRGRITKDEFNTLLLDMDDSVKGAAYIRLSDPDGFLLSNELISVAFRVIDA